MNIFEKLNIIFSYKNDEYSQKVDNLINKFINNAKIMYFDKYELTILYKNSLYKIWVTNYPYADLSMVITEKNKGSNIFNEYVYCDLRPSRKTQIRFWEWCEKHGIEPNDIGNITSKYINSKYF